MKRIRIPKTPRLAFKPGRPASGLILSQLEQLEAVHGVYKDDVVPGPKRRNTPKPMTEKEAARYIEGLTRHLHPEASPKRTRTQGARRASPRKAATRKRTGGLKK